MSKQFILVFVTVLSITTGVVSAGLNNGLVGEAMIFDKSLTATEIQQLYQDGPN